MNAIEKVSALIQQGEKSALEFKSVRVHADSVAFAEIGEEFQVVLPL